MEITWIHLAIILIACLAGIPILGEINNPTMSDKQIEKLVLSVHLGKPMPLRSNASEMELRLHSAALKTQWEREERLALMDDKEKELALKFYNELEAALTKD